MATELKAFGQDQLAGMSNTELLGLMRDSSVSPESAAYAMVIIQSRIANAEKEAAEAKAAAAESGTCRVTEIISTKPTKITIRTSGRGFPINSSVAKFEALLGDRTNDDGTTTPWVDVLRDVCKQVRSAGNDAKKHSALKCFGVAKAKREEEERDDESADEPETAPAAPAPQPTGNSGQTVGAALTGRVRKPQ